MPFEALAIHQAPQALLVETKPCACCSGEISCGEYGDDLDGFDAGILAADRLLVCTACAPDYIEDQAQWEAPRPYEGGRAVYL